MVYMFFRKMNNSLHEVFFILVFFVAQAGAGFDLRDCL
jgi:hypothetical protein